MYKYLTFTNLFRFIGIFSYIFLFFLTIYLLVYEQKYISNLYFFIIGFFLNFLLNIILKILIKDPRPINDAKLIEIGVVNGNRYSFDVYGMPSGHSQFNTFILTFVTFLFNKPSITTFYLLVSTITITQRYFFNNHTFLQIFFGIIIGTLCGYLTYLAANKYITDNYLNNIKINNPTNNNNE